MTPDNGKIVPFSLRNAPALIEVLFPAQKVSMEAYKEKMSSHAQSLVTLGGYWKARKPLILNKACILGSLLPATIDLKRDLEIFEMLMGMDELSFPVRLGRLTPETIVEKINIPDISDYFVVTPTGALPKTAPFKIDEHAFEKNGKLICPNISWKNDIPDKTRRRIEASALREQTYASLVDVAERPESCLPHIHDHIWDEVNEHLGTNASCVDDVVRQIGVMRFGRTPRVADTFSGSGQIPFEAARLGCDVYASDLNPVASMLTWGALNVVGASKERLAELQIEQAETARKLTSEMDRLGFETGPDGAKAKVFLYCLETTCHQSGGWSVPMLPSLVISQGYGVVARLVPDHALKKYNIEVIQNATPTQIEAAQKGTVQSEGRGKPSYLVHVLDGNTYKTRIETIRGDYTAEDKTTKNRLRLWAKEDIRPRADDIFRERLFAVQWQRKIVSGSKTKTESFFRAPSVEDLAREEAVFKHVSENLSDWQRKGWIPDMVIEKGDETERLYKERGWTHWHQLFNPRQLLTASIINRFSGAPGKFALGQLLNNNCRSTRWRPQAGGGGGTAGVFDTQALNTLYNYPSRGVIYLSGLLTPEHKSFPVPDGSSVTILNHPASQVEQQNDIYVTDPPYGDAVKYEEILEFFIAWMRKNPPPEFAGWTWDSRRALAVKGEDHDFKLAMVAAFKRMTEMMPDNGIQILMFTHQSGSIWADIANIVWASDLRVSAAWYVVTETMKRIQEDGSYVKGTVLLVLRKRMGRLSTFRDDLAMELEDEVKAQVATLTGLNQQTRDLYREDNLFTDSDLQMAGYAAALRVLTRYAEIDGADMTTEALRPREKGKETRVDKLIEYAVEIANQCLIPEGFSEEHWRRLVPGERFFLKMIDMESHGHKTLENYQNFAKAFKVRDFKVFMSSQKANDARIKSAAEFGRSEMSGDSELAGTPLRAALYAMTEIDKGAEPETVLSHISDNLPDYMRRRDTVIACADFMASCLPRIREDEAAAARILRDLVKNERIG